MEIKSCELIPSFIIQYQPLHGYNQIGDDTGTTGCQTRAQRQDDLNDNSIFTLFCV